MDSMRSYRHGNLPVALLAAAREILDENGLQAVGLRETARRVGVSATAAYRHFTNKEDLLASVAAQGFHELAEAMQGATRGADPLIRGGLAYIEFANQNRGLFRLMFGPVLAERTKYPALQAASAGVEAMLVRGVTDIDPRPLNDNHAAMAAWGLVHGLAHLIVDGFFPATRAMVQAEEILAKVRLPRPPALGADLIAPQPPGVARAPANRTLFRRLAHRFAHRGAQVVDRGQSARRARHARRSSRCRRAILAPARRSCGSSRRQGLRRARHRPAPERYGGRPASTRCSPGRASPASTTLEKATRGSLRRVGAIASAASGNGSTASIRWRAASA